MIPISTFKDKRVAVFGLGGSGLATVKALLAGGATVHAGDDSPASQRAAAAVDIPVENLREVDFSTLDALILAPGVPLTHPEPHWTVKKAQVAGIEVIGDIELFARERRSVAPGTDFVAITGTNGKSTTTALIAHLLRQAGRDVHMGGNIGTAVLSLGSLQPGRTYVVECSSFQIDLAPTLDPTVGVHMNLSEDHLDRHGTMEAYCAIKERLVAKAATAVVGTDDNLSQAIADRLERAGGRVSRISARRPLAHGVYAEDGHLVEASTGAATIIGDLTGIISLRGRHNAQNAAAAAAAVRALGLDARTIMAGLKSFPGLNHRMKLIGREGKVLFVNDSKATNADSAAQALGSFGRIHWIAGGKPKSGGIESLTSFLPSIAKTYLIGAATEEFAATLAAHGAPFERCGDLATAVARAAEDALRDPSPEPVVLLSPACASYDQFPNFEVRGDTFRALVIDRPGVTPVDL
jgi:UDP-N-acetylmuramoylalanine--D-glutamate ligase